MTPRAYDKISSSVAFSFKDAPATPTTEKTISAHTKQIILPIYITTYQRASPLWLRYAVHAGPRLPYPCQDLGRVVFQQLIQPFEYIFIHIYTLLIISSIILICLKCFWGALLAAVTRRLRVLPARDLGTITTPPQNWPSGGYQPRAQPLFWPPFRRCALRSGVCAPPYEGACIALRRVPS